MNHEIFEEGSLAHANFEGKEANPYPFGSDNHRDWLSGYEAAEEHHEADEAGEG